MARGRDDAGQTDGRRWWVGGRTAAAAATVVGGGCCGGGDDDGQTCVIWPRWRTGGWAAAVKVVVRGDVGGG